MYPQWMNEILICPETSGTLQLKEGNYQRNDGYVYPLKNDILSVVYPKELSGDDARFNRMYNVWAPFYDLNERVMGKLLLGIDMVEVRKDMVSKLGLKPGMKILEVSPGPGVYQKFLRTEIGATGELVALDLSLGMLRQCQRKNDNLNVHLVHGNAQHLPFADNSFDALFHFGGVNLFNNPDKAINEFIRVVKKDGIVSWGDEGFSPNYKNERRKRLLLKINPGFNRPHPIIPDSLYNVSEHEVCMGLGYLVTGKKL